MAAAVHFCIAWDGLFFCISACPLHGVFVFLGRLFGFLGHGFLPFLFKSFPLFHSRAACNSHFLGQAGSPLRWERGSSGHVLLLVFAVSQVAWEAKVI